MSKIARLTCAVFPLCLGWAAAAQTPEGLPSGYAGRQFTDAAGCQYQRSDDGLWTARLGRDGKPLCGYAPTVIAPPTAADPYDALAQDDGVQPPTAAPTSPTAPQTAEAPPPAAPRAQAAPPDAPAAPQDAAEALAMDPSIRAPVGPAPPAVLPVLEGPPKLSAPAPQTATIQTARKAAPARTKATPQRRKTAKAAPAHTRPAQPVATPHRYVQVGAFGVPSNARRAERCIDAMGLPVSRGKSLLRGQWLEVIMAGPFENGADLRAARGLLRQNGYPKAFTR